jgi:hypothetical protein
MKFVAEPPPTVQPPGQATKFVADPPPTVQPEYLFGKVTRPVVRLMSTWNVEPVPPSLPPSVPPPLPDAAEPHPNIEAREASTTIRTAIGHAIERIPSALRAKSPEAVSAMRLCIESSYRPLDRPTTFAPMSRRRAVLAS